MPVDTNYAPKYIALEDVPITGPDEYGDGQKRKALFEAESTLELDVNDGAEITSTELTDGHRTAVMLLGTHILTHSAGSPDDVTLGDMSDSGSQSMEYSSKYMERYDALVEKLRETTGGDAGYGNVSVSTNTRDGDQMEQEYPFRRDNRFPDDP